MSFYEVLADQNQYSYFKKRELFFTPAHMHGSVEFLFVESGEQIVLINGKEYTVRAGEGCFYDSFDVHAYEKVSGAVGYVILSSREFFESFYKSVDGKVPPHHFKFSNLSLINTLYNAYNKDYFDDKLKKAFFYGATSVILSQIARENTLTESKKDKSCSFICSLLDYAEKNYASDLSISFLSKKFGYSREHFSRLVKKFLVSSWGNYVNALRAKKAERLIRENGLTVSAAALSCGFESANSFYRAYKKEFGKTPKE